MLSSVPKPCTTFIDQLLHLSPLSWEPGFCKLIFLDCEGFCNCGENSFFVLLSCEEISDGDVPTHLCHLGSMLNYI
jgi:hypothetical protein